MQRSRERKQQVQRPEAEAHWACLRRRMEGCMDGKQWPRCREQEPHLHANKQKESERGSGKHC